MNNRELYLIAVTTCQTLIILTFIFSIYTAKLEVESSYQNYSNQELQNLLGWEKYIDPYGSNKSTSGLNNSKRPFPIQNTTGNSETCYTIIIGNVLLIMWGDDGGSHNYIENKDWFYSQLENNSDKNILICTHHLTSGIISEVNQNLKKMKDSTNIVAWLRGHVHYYGWAGLETQLPMGWASAYWIGTRVYYIPEWNITHVYISAIDTCHTGDFSHSYLFTFSEGSKTIQIGDFNHTSNRWNDSTPVAPGNYTLQMKYPFKYYETNKSENSEKEEMKLRIWFSSDHHVDCNSSQFLDAVHDADIYFPAWDISCVLGDLVDVASPKSYQLWQNIRSESNHPREDFYVIRGNHDD